MCVCVLGDVMFLCQSMLLLLSGWLQFAMRLPQRCFVCLHSRFRFLMLMWGVARPAAFVCNVLCSVPVSLCVLGDVMFRCLSMCSLLSGSHFTHTPHPHHTTATHHTQSSPLISLPPRLALAHASLRWHTVVLCLWMHFVLDQVYPNYPKLYHPSQVKPS